MIRLGLTGSIGTGKSTTARLFRALGVPVHDADASVHALYSGVAAPLIEQAFPGATENGVVNRKTLAALLSGKNAHYQRLEAIIHPLVRQSEDHFIAAAKRDHQRLVVLDLPLLFESGARGRCDLVLVTSVSAAEQKKRVFQRPGMNEALFATLLARQMPDAEKRSRAHWILDTSKGIEHAKYEVEALIRAIAPII
jgi:dephospho-CoA kinase